MRKPHSRWLLVLNVVWLSTLAHAQAPLAPIMPLADQSLLLDITTSNDRLVAAGERGHILYSDDKGNTWTQASVPTTQMLTAIHFDTTGERGWAVGHDGIVLRTGDRGANWAKVRDGLAAQRQQSGTQAEQARLDTRRLEALINEAEQASPPDETALDELNLALEDARYALEDAEFALAEPTFASPLLDVWFADTQRGWAVGAFGTLIATQDGGSSWINQATRLDNPDEYHLNAITGDGAGRLLIAGEGGVLFRSVDAGASWTALPPIYAGSWFGAVYESHSAALLVFGLRGNLFRSVDFGDNWDRVDIDNSLTLAGGNASDDGNVVLAGSVGVIVYSSDGGRSFSKTTIKDRLSLSSALRRDNTILVVGQGGIKQVEITP